ncbi:MAG TPA: hypothetical protein VFE57_02040, partial [Cyclobacteriaceae bacterium]|nr:hypothetical protein [Cyclobacteriaceae bacterium]
SPYSSGMSMGMGMGFGTSFYSPYGYNPMMSGYGMGYGSYYGGYPSYYGYPTTVVVDNSSNITYGKRSSRSSVISNSVIPSNHANVSPAITPDQSGQYVIPTGRTSTTQQYYQPNWRNSPDVISNMDSGTRGSGSSYSRSQSLGTQNPSWNNGNINTTRQSQTPTWNSNSRQSIPGSFESPSRGSSSTPSWGGGGGFSGGSSGGGGGAPSRGR